MPYSTIAQLRLLLGTDLTNDLLTLDASTSTTDVYNQLVADADRYIDADLGQIYTVPFDSTIASTTIVNTLSKYKTAELLFQLRHPGDDDELRWADEYTSAVEPLISGDREVPGAGKVDTDAGTVAFSHSVGDAGPQHAGTDDENDGIDRMIGW